MNFIKCSDCERIVVKYDLINMKWKEFKDTLESKGVTDDMNVYFIHMAGDVLSNCMEVEVSRTVNAFTVNDYADMHKSKWGKV